MRSFTTLGIGLCVGLLAGAVLGQKLLAAPALGALTGAILGLACSVAIDKHIKK